MLLSKNQPTPYICAVGGRSGGHIIPCLSYIEQKKHSTPFNTLLFHSNDALSRSLVSHYNSSTDIRVPLSVDPVPYKQWYMWPWWILQLIYAFFKSVVIFIYYRPLEVMSSGGLESIPVCLAARLLGISVTLIELNIVPGKAVQFLAHLLPTVSICFKETASYLPHTKTQLISYPLRFSQEQLNTMRSHALSYYQLDSTKKTIVILGGSQGSCTLNKIAMKSILQINDHCEKFQVIHQIGNDNFSIYKHAYTNHSIEGIVIAFEKNMHYLYAIADVVIARAGAGTLFELEAFNKPSIIIPLVTSTTDHQKDNALAFSLKNPQQFCMFDQKTVELNTSLITDKLLEYLK